MAKAKRKAKGKGKAKKTKKTKAKGSRSGTSGKEMWRRIREPKPEKKDVGTQTGIYKPTRKRALPKEAWPMTTSRALDALSGLTKEAIDEVMGQLQRRIDLPGSVCMYD